MSELHVLFPPAAPAREQGVEIRSEEPLLAPAPDARPMGLGAAHAFRLGVRHTLMRFRLWIAAMAVLLLVPLTGLWFLAPLPRFMTLLVPIVAFLAAIDGDGRAERFWVGMGGPPAMRELGRMAVDLGLLHIALGLAVLQSPPELTVTFGYSWAISLVVYSFGGLTRSIASSTQGRIAAAMGLGLVSLGVGVLPHLALELVPTPVVLVVQALGMIPVALVARLVLTGRWSTASAARRWWSPAWLLGPILFLFPLLCAVLSGIGLLPADLIALEGF